MEFEVRKDINTFNTKEAAEAVLSMSREGTPVGGREKYPLRYYKGRFWEYIGTHYVHIPDQTLKVRLSSFLGKVYDGDIESNHKNATLTELKELCHVDDRSVMPSWIEWVDKDNAPVGNPDKRFLAVQNGLLDVEAAVAGRKDALKPHSPQWFSTTCLPYKYDPNATCPMWKTILKQNVGGDPELGRLIQEWFGYHLSTDTNLQRFVIMVGDGGTGKSTTLAALQAVLGIENCSAVPLERFGERFDLWQMFGKIANIAPEIGNGSPNAESILKAIASGDQITLEQKTKDTIPVRLPIKLTFATNSLPRFKDRTGAIWRRLIVLPFNRKVPDQERILGLDQPGYWSPDELSGMLNWMIEGLRRIRARKRFARSKQAENAQNKHRLACNPEKQFVTEHVSGDPQAEVNTVEFAEAYRDFCASSGYPVNGSPQFKGELVKRFGSKVGKRKSGSRRYWTGIRLT